MINQFATTMIHLFIAMSLIIMYDGIPHLIRQKITDRKKLGMCTIGV